VKAVEQTRPLVEIQTVEVGRGRLKEVAEVRGGDRWRQMWVGPAATCVFVGGPHN